MDHHEPTLANVGGPDHQGLSRRFTASAAKALRAEILSRLEALLSHSGHGDLCISVRWAKRGTREVIVSGGPQERFLLREMPSPDGSNRPE